MADDTANPAAQPEPTVEELKLRIQKLEEGNKALLADVAKHSRRRLPDTRQAVTHKLDISGHEGYVTVGLYEDGTPGEVFITMAREGSTIGGLMDAIGSLMSLALQHGIPIEVFVKKFANQRFEPCGFTKNPNIPIAKSIMDYIVRWMAIEFIPGYREANPSGSGEIQLPSGGATGQTTTHDVKHILQDCPICDTCGAVTVRNGACYKCLNCGNTMGCS